MGEVERQQLAAVLAETETPEELLRAHLSNAQYRLLIELTHGERYDELNEEEPLDLLADVNSHF